MTDVEFRIHLHTKLSDIADLIIYHFNPCGLQDGQCREGRLRECCRNTVYDTFKDGKLSCLFLTDHGCKTKSLGCKIWFCWEAFDILPSKVKRLLKAIELIDRIYMLSSYLPDLYRAELDEYDYRDVAKYFDESFH